MCVYLKPAEISLQKHEPFFFSSSSSSSTILFFFLSFFFFFLYLILSPFLFFPHLLSLPSRVAIIPLITSEMQSIQPEMIQVRPPIVNVWDYLELYDGVKYLDRTSSTLTSPTRLPQWWKWRHRWWKTLRENNIFVRDVFFSLGLFFHPVCLCTNAK